MTVAGPDVEADHSRGVGADQGPLRFDAHQLFDVRQHPVPCGVCRQPTANDSGLCDEPDCQDAIGADSLNWRTACIAIGCTYRQLDYWIRAGHFGSTIPARMSARGSGSRRRFDDADLEVGWAIAELARQHQHRAMPYVADLVRSRRVDAGGELLILLAPTEAVRVRRGDPLPAIDHTSLLVPLRAFEALRATASAA